MRGGGGGGGGGVSNNFMLISGAFRLKVPKIAIKGT